MAETVAISLTKYEDLHLGDRKVMAAKAPGVMVLSLKVEQLDWWGILAKLSDMEEMIKMDATELGCFHNKRPFCNTPPP